MDQQQQQQSGRQSAISIFSEIEAGFSNVMDCGEVTVCVCNCKGACVRSCPCKKASRGHCIPDQCSCDQHRCKNRATQIDSTVENAEDRQMTTYERNDTVETYIDSLDEGKMKGVLRSILNKHPNIAETIMQDQGPSSYPPTQHKVPEWCKCQRCRPMPTAREMTCCRKRSCITLSPNCRQVCSMGEVLRTAITSRSYDFVRTPTYDNRSMRHSGYRQYVMWEYGRLGKGNRVVCPSCVVWMIRDKFPSGDGKYTGFRDSGRN